VVATDENSLTLAGNSPRGTLYAVYDFLKTQGCRWYLPGKRGEVIPKRGNLDLPPRFASRTRNLAPSVRFQRLMKSLDGAENEL